MSNTLNITTNSPVRVRENNGVVVVVEENNKNDATTTNFEKRVKEYEALNKKLEGSLDYNYLGDGNIKKEGRRGGISYMMGDGCNNGSMKDEARFSSTPEQVPSPKDEASPREEPLLEAAKQQLENQHERLQRGGRSSSSEEEEQQLQPPSKSNDEGVDSMELELPTKTTSSSISEDLTFNSYAPSELSSMMSHLEIQQLLKHGRQQQHDIMAMNNNSPTVPETVGGGRGRRGTSQPPKPMVLYANQSVYAPLPSLSGSQNHPPNIGGNTNDIASSGPFRNQPSPPSSSGQEEFPHVQSSPSSSSYLLQRTDAMEDASLNLSNNDAGRMMMEEVYPQIHPARALTPQSQLSAQQQPSEQYHYPHLVVQGNSTFTTMASMSSTIATEQSTVQSGPAARYQQYHGGNNNYAVNSSSRNLHHPHLQGMMISPRSACTKPTII